MISRSRLHLVIALLLPLLALKALLPPGYMPSAGDGQLRIVMCSAGLAAFTDHGDPDAPPAAQDSCAFAMAGVAAPPPSIAIYWLPSSAPRLPAADGVAIAVPATALLRSQSPRGPPALHNA